MNQERMKVVLDTTYFLPLFGLEVTQLETSKEKWLLLFENGHENLELIVPTVIFQELTQLLIREYKKANNQNISERYSLGISTIIKKDHFSMINPYLNPAMAEIAFKLRYLGHKDLFDCFIASSALNLGAIFVSEDRPLKKKVKEVSEYKNQITLSWNEFLKSTLMK